MIVTRITRPTFRIERKLDYWHGEPCGDFPHRQVRTFMTEWAAYLCAARWRIFERRDEVCGPTDKPCSLCDVAPADSFESDGSRITNYCRYHGENFKRLERRLARWLRWRDRREAELAAPPQVAGMLVSPVSVNVYRVPRPTEGPHGGRHSSFVTYFSAHGAYMHLGREAVFNVRDKLVGENVNCPLCKKMPSWPYDPEDGPPRCRWHSDSGFHKRVARAARWLKWLDGKKAAKREVPA